MNFFRLTILFLVFIWILSFDCFAENNRLLKTNSFFGHIYYGQEQLTNFHKDFSPVLAPNKKWISFVREKNQEIPDECGNFSDAKDNKAQQLWIFDIKNKKEYLLVDSNLSCSDPQKQIVDIKNIKFSPDSKIIYFITSAWVTSGAVHAVNVINKTLSYVAPGNSFSLVSHGRYAGYLIVNQHRYSPNGESYDGFWLLDPHGKEVRALGRS